MCGRDRDGKLAVQPVSTLRLLDGLFEVCLLGDEREQSLQVVHGRRRRTYHRHVVHRSKSPEAADVGSPEEHKLSSGLDTARGGQCLTDLGRGDIFETARYKCADS